MNHPAADSPYPLPSDLPVPLDDGAALHLMQARLPPVTLEATSGGRVTPSDLTGPTVLFFYPRTGIPGQPPSLGFQGQEWDAIPGARGCTPQSCAFRDLAADFAALGISVYGVSTSTRAHQEEFQDRVHLPFPQLSDSDLALATALRLPIFRFPVESGGPDTLIQRLAVYCEDGYILKIWYPVFPPDRNAAEVLQWLKQRAGIRLRPIEQGNAGDAAYLTQEMVRHWGSTQIWSRGEAYEGLELDGLMAEVNGVRAGALTWAALPGGYQFEVVTVSTSTESGGVGEKLLDRAVQAGRSLGCTRAFLTTTNDNMRALRFYQKRGWRLAALHRGIVDEARRRKPSIPRLGLGGIPLRDEIELELWLQPAAEVAP